MVLSYILINQRKEKMRILNFIIAMVISYIPGVFGMFFSPGRSIPAALWYNSLRTPSITPSGTIISIIWNVLYALLGIALFLVIDSKRNDIRKGRAYGLFGAHVVLNAAWSWVFFGMNWMWIGLALIVGMIIIAFMMQSEFHKLNKSAGYLVWPYIIW